MGKDTITKRWSPESRYMNLCVQSYTLLFLKCLLARLAHAGIWKLRFQDSYQVPKDPGVSLYLNYANNMVYIQYRSLSEGLEF